MKYFQELVPVGVPGSRFTEGNTYLFQLRVTHPDDFRGEKCPKKSTCEIMFNFGSLITNERTEVAYYLQNWCNNEGIGNCDNCVCSSGACPGPIQVCCGAIIQFVQCDVTARRLGGCDAILLCHGISVSPIDCLNFHKGAIRICMYEATDVIRMLDDNSAMRLCDTTGAICILDAIPGSVGHFQGGTNCCWYSVNDYLVRVGVLEIYLRSQKSFNGQKYYCCAPLCSTTKSGKSGL